MSSPSAFPGPRPCRYTPLLWLRQASLDRLSGTAFCETSRTHDLSQINEKTHSGTTRFQFGLCGKLGRTVEYLGDFEVCECRISPVSLGPEPRGVRAVQVEAHQVVPDFGVARRRGVCAVTT